MIPPADDQPPASAPREGCTGWVFRRHVLLFLLATVGVIYLTWRGL